jgi:hypothetical protein
MERKFDWEPNPDAASANFPIRTMMSGASTRTSRYHSTLGVYPLNQGQEGACVGHGVTHALMTTPLRTLVFNHQALAFGMYYGSRRIDEWPGDDYDGTSVNAGMKLARELGLIREWRWCADAEEMAQAILEIGPVVIGVWWTDQMYQTDQDGLVRTDGAKVGGHCLMVNGFSRNRSVGSYTGPLFRWQNSWGTEYGVGGKGYGYVPFDTMAALIADEGEAAVPFK